MHMGGISICIYKYVWQFLHYLLNLYEFCLWLRLRVIAFTLMSYDLCRTQAEREENEYDFLQQCKKQLNKIPKHLNLIIGPDNIHVNDELLTRIFSYALHMDINCVSYYDTRYTNPNSSKRVLALEKLECPKGWKRKNIDAHHSVWYICKDEMCNGNNKHKVNGLNGTSNIYKTTSRNGNFHNTSLSSVPRVTNLEIHEIKPQSNHALLARVCRDLFQQRHTKEIQNLLEERALLTERINKELMNHLHNLTEPELSIVFHDDLCTFGMLPWHIRFTEFHQHSDAKHFDVKAFAHILYKYSRCEQRWGK